jgi:hypothetical protein
MDQVRFRFLDKQRQMVHVPHDQSLDLCLYVGGFGSGKTHGGVLLGMILSHAFPGSCGLVGAAEHTLLRDTTRRKYAELIPESWIESWKQSPDNLVFRNGSEVWFRGLREPERLKSKEFNWIHIEEASQVSESTFRMLLGRLRHNANGYNPRYPALARSQRVKRLFMTTNPEETPGWLHRMFEDDTYRTEHDLHETYRRVHAPTFENTFLLNEQPDYVESMLQVYDEDYAQVYVYGQTGNLGGRRVYHAFDPRLNVRPELRFDPELPLRLCCDFNVEPMAWLVAQITRTREVHVVDEIVIERDALTETACEEVLRRYARWQGGLIVYGDASGGSRSTRTARTNHDIIRARLGAVPGFAWRVPNRNPPVRDRVILVNGLLCNTQSERRLFVHPRCEYLTRDLRELKRPRDGRGEIEKVSDLCDWRHELSHASDALGYMIHAEFALRPACMHSARIRV